MAQGVSPPAHEQHLLAAEGGRQLLAAASSADQRRGTVAGWAECFLRPEPGNCFLRAEASADLAQETAGPGLVSPGPRRGSSWRLQHSGA